MTSQEKANEIIENLGVFNGIYLIDEVLIVLEDYPVNNKDEWLEVRDIVSKRMESIVKSVHD